MKQLGLNQLVFIQLGLHSIEVILMTVVLKIGGARAVDPAGAIGDVASLVEDGEEVIVVHGGSTAVDDTLEQLGEEPTYVETPSGVVGRFTDEKTIDVFKMVLPGRLNTDIVAALQNNDVDAVGLSGVDGKVLSGPRKSAVRVVEDGKRKIKRGDHSGIIKSVNDDLLTTLLSGGYTPVVTVPMLGKDDDRWLPVNADADRAAAAIAGAVDGDLVLLTDVPGVLEDPDDPETIIEQANTPEELEKIESAAEGFMKRKIMAAKESIESGASRVIIGDANTEMPVQSALDGAGTHIKNTAVPDQTEGSKE